MSDPGADDYIAAAWQAAPAFGLSPDTIRVLSHSENVVCELTMPAGERQVMRLHRPGYNTLNELESEVQWVTALGQAGIPVPTALATTEGSHYTTVAVHGQPVHVSVVGWVHGEPLGAPTESRGADVVDHYAQIGTISAQIRAHHRTWELPPEFVRRRWDADGLVGESPLWGRFWEVAALSASQRDLFTSARVALVQDLGAMPTNGEHFGLIHSDLHLGNVMADGDRLTVIDFDDAGFGWFAHELAVSLHPVLDEPFFDDARATLLQGYRAVCPLSEHEESWIDTFLTVRCLMIVAWLDARREVPIYEHFGDLAAQAEAQAERYLAAR